MRGLVMAMLGLLVTVPANAAIVTRDFSLTASNFVNFNNLPSPITSLTATFRITYDDTLTGFQGAPASFTSVTNGVANVGSFAVPAVYGYFPSGGFFNGPSFGVGGALNGGNVLLNNTDDFYVAFSATATGPTNATLSFTSVGFATPFMATNAIVTPIQNSAAVPEPATWGMLLLGFGLVGGMLRRRQSMAIRFA